MRRVPMHMADWIEKLNGFLTLNDRDLLTHVGRISHEMAQAKAEPEYDRFQRAHRQCASPGGRRLRAGHEGFEEAAKTEEDQVTEE